MGCGGLLVLVLLDSSGAVNMGSSSVVSVWCSPALVSTQLCRPTSLMKKEEDSLMFLGVIARWLRPLLWR